MIEELEQMINTLVQDEGIEEVTIGNVKIMLFIYVDDGLLANNLEDAQKLMRIL
jgi:hypothetical protein